MKFKLRLLPLVVITTITSVVLFGGWFAYHSVALKSPLASILSEIEGVESAEASIQRTQVVIKLTLANDASLREILANIKSEGSSIIGSRELILDVINPSSSELDQWWSTVLFDVAEAMETKNYSNIPQDLDQKKGQLEHLSVSTEMDDVNVYIRLVHKDQSKFIILPRIPVQLGVWDNE